MKTKYVSFNALFAFICAGSTYLAVFYLVGTIADWIERILNSTPIYFQNFGKAEWQKNGGIEFYQYGLSCILYILVGQYFYNDDKVKFGLLLLTILGALMILNIPIKIYNFEHPYYAAFISLMFSFFTVHHENLK
jgi:hypothetical protein